MEVYNPVALRTEDSIEPSPDSIGRNCGSNGLEGTLRSRDQLRPTIQSHDMLRAFGQEGFAPQRLDAATGSRYSVGPDSQRLRRYDASRSKPRTWYAQYRFIASQNYLPQREAGKLVRSRRLARGRSLGHSELSPGHQDNQEEVATNLKLGGGGECFMQGDSVDR